MAKDCIKILKEATKDFLDEKDAEEFLKRVEELAKTTKED